VTVMSSPAVDQALFDGSSLNVFKRISTSE